ncbi:single-stranded DNA-binding protein [Pseudorhodoferax sp. Leaf267]|uniref:single-stranded DNA-binding protein n=1 Tax=Pseudorhodoferax sp. Leaf267 TaxID=1736316 RepID=UPI0006FE85F1|nr:single-stranded DNA-binding protein [Pseudorhodoferax sp. Leaf267]KQP12330.1 single-stranded DNA-binding protein [Pseudorhodoferax sp. Leaf267]
MASVNKVIIVGNLGRDPEVRSFPSGDRVANVTVATTETWKDKQTGERREATEWHRLVFRGRLVDIVEQYLRKGSQVYIEGSIRSRKYNDASGAEKSITEINVNEMTMLGSRQGMGGPGPSSGGGDDDGGYEAPRRPAPASRPAAAAPRAPAAAPKASSGFDDMDDDIPF